MYITKLSSKGQLVIPKVFRKSHGWRAGTKFVVIEYDDGILLKPAAPQKDVTIDNVIGCTGYKGPPKSLEEMEAGIIKGAKKDDKR